MSREMVEELMTCFSVSCPLFIISYLHLDGGKSYKIKNYTFLFVYWPEKFKTGEMKLISIFDSAFSGRTA